MLISGKNPGGPIDWVSGSLSAPLSPVLKGGVLAGKALLVKNHKETIFNDPSRCPSYGEEIQMVILTYGITGKPNTKDEGLVIGGMISPSGYGDGYASSDRYRILGKPMFAPNNQNHASLQVTPVPYLKNEK